MRRLTLPTLALAIGLASPAGAAETVTQRDRFELWNGCRPMGLIVENLSKAATDIGLTTTAIEVAARSRLRSARLYADASEPLLWISVTAVSTAHAVIVGYHKWVKDEASDITEIAMTWFVGSAGLHGRSAPNVLSVVTGFTDKFIDEYLRVNADACGKSN